MRHAQTCLQVLHTDLMVIRMEHRLNQRVATEVVRRVSELGLDNAGLASHLDISEATLVRRLTSQTSFTVTELAHIANYLGCALADLLPSSAYRAEVS